METTQEIIPYSTIYHELWERGELSFLLDPLQQQIRSKIHKSNSDEICILSSRQIGKSYLAVVLALEHCIKEPGSIVRVLSPTLKQTSDIVNDNLSRIIQTAPPNLIMRQKSEYRWHVGDSTLRLGSLDRSNVDSNRGGNCSLAFLEEGGFTSSADFEYAINSVIGPMLIRSGGRAIHISSPSEDPSHYLHEVIAPKCEINNALFRFTVYDSPSLSREQISKAAERCGGFESEAFRREYLAEIIRSTQLMIVPEFDEARHVSEFELPEYYKALVQLDLGGTVDKTAILSCVWDFDRQRMLVFDEALLEPNTPSSDVVSRSRELESALNWRSDQPYICGDMPGQLQIDFERDFGYRVIIPAKDDRDAQIAAVRRMFQLDKILIHKRCKFLIGNLKSGRYNNKRTDFERHPVFGHCDPLMALVYANRMLDKTSNPYPSRTYNRDTQLLAPYRSKVDGDLEQISKELMPYNPLRKITRMR